MREIDLDDRYTESAGPVMLGGIQALVRMFLEQRRIDRDRDLDTGVFVSGYPGSPLGGLDREIVRSRRFLEPAGVVFQPGVNEELAATAVAGTQLVESLPDRNLDGVVGFWYGKAPGLDRAADAIRHGNVSGTAHLGGAVALIGDDPLCKSSTLPSSCELMAESLMLPLVSPGRVEEVIPLGLHAVALSRQAGLWSAMKVVSDVADATASVDLAATGAATVPMPPRAGRGPAPMLIGASSVAAEHDLIANRLELARGYGREHKLNRVVFEPVAPRVAVLAPGSAFATLQRSLEQLRIDPEDLERLGVRLVRLGLVWPLHADDVRAFAAGCEELIVVEDKRPFVERQVRDILYGERGAPLVVGKQDERGRPFVPIDGAVSGDALARLLARRWKLELPPAVRAAEQRLPPASLASRTPFFCSGCPHNLSTRADEDQLVGAGIGCHSLVLLDPAGTRGDVLGAPQMGGEGAQWIGMAPFSNEKHYVQNIGDGTFHHSGSLAIRAAVAAGIDITYRILYNDAVAMTGGQAPAGKIDVPELTRWLELEGVTRIVITTEDPASFASSQLSPLATVRDRSELAAVQAELATVAGVTALVHTDRCATEERRLRKRGKLPTPPERVWINERVCEGCGDCGRKSSCLSVVPVETEFGRKTMIHQASCTQDLACLEGDCPSFLLVTAGRKGREAARPELPFELPAPTPKLVAGEPFLVRMPGIGGTGVVTVSQVLQMAANLEGRWASGLDQTGLAQKGGPVVSDIRIADVPKEGAPRAAAAEVDLMLGLDPLGAGAPETLLTMDPERTIAIVNLEAAATAAAVTDPATPPPDLAEIVERVEAASRADQALWIDAGEISERLFGGHMATNMIMLGAAFQHGCLPVGEGAMAEAIRLNGVDVDNNLAAFAWGRAAVVDPARVRAAVNRARPPVAGPPKAELDRSLEVAVGALADPGALRELLAVRIADLEGYQSRRYASEYAAEVEGVLERERSAVGSGAGAVTTAFAVGLHKLMAYKDEYEVARLHLDSIERARREDQFGAGASASVLLHPPLLRALGLKRKIRLRRSAAPLFRALRTFRFLRGTAFDPFGYAKLRRIERALIREYRDLIDAALVSLAPDSQEAVAELAALPDLVRGYEGIKLDSVARFRAAAVEGLAALGRTESVGS